MDNQPNGSPADHLKWQKGTTIQKAALLTTSNDKNGQPTERQPSWPPKMTKSKNHPNVSLAENLKWPKWDNHPNGHPADNLKWQKRDNQKYAKQPDDNSDEMQLDDNPGENQPDRIPFEKLCWRSFVVISKGGHASPLSRYAIFYSNAAHLWTWVIISYRVYWHKRSPPPCGSNLFDNVCQRNKGNYSKQTCKRHLLVHYKA